MKAKSNVRKIYGLIIKIAIIVVAYGFLYKQIFHREDLKEVWNAFHAVFINSSSVFFVVALVLLMMLFNWGVETFKWKILMNKIEKIPFSRSFKAVLTGITVSTITPNRVGEYFGRVFILKKASHWEGIFITVIGSMSQLLITIIVGIFSLLFFVPNYMNYMDYVSSSTLIVLMLLAVLLVALLLFLFFNISIVHTLVYKLKLPKRNKIRKYVRIFLFYSSKELLQILLLSLLRYAIFTTQYFILMRLFGLDLPYFISCMLISIIFFVTTAIPTIALADLGVRGSVSLFVLGLYYDKLGMDQMHIDMSIVAASSLLWIINLVLPALIESIFVFDLRFFRKGTKS